MLNKYLVFKLALHAVLDPKIMAILGTNDSCDWHIDCTRLSSVHSAAYCCRDYSTNSSRSCRTNISSCLDRFCMSDYECVNSKERCSRSKKCTKCSYCFNNSDCGRDQYCCMNRCRSSCIGNPCSHPLHCGAPGECCRTGKCLKCPGTGCASNFECTSGKHCCIREDEYLEQSSSSCIGKPCRYHGDCGGNRECCQSNKCVKCPLETCKSHLHCPTGQYCCGTRGSYFSIKGICNESCVGEQCTSNKDCPHGECCHSDVCTRSGCLCLSNNYCSDGHYCCKRTSYGQCNTSCIGKYCFTNYDCGGQSLREWCRNGVCVKDQCHYHFDCEKQEHSCCKKQFLNESSECKTHCINESCSNNGDCARSNECCNTNHMCTSNCQKHFPLWLILVIASSIVFVVGLVACVIKLYFHMKPVHPRTSQPHFQDSVEMFPTQNEDTTVPNNVLNVPPPPYSTNDEAFPPELEQDFPPNYQLI